MNKCVATLVLALQMQLASALTFDLNNFTGPLGSGFFQLWGDFSASDNVVLPGGETVAELRLANDDFGQEIGLSGLYPVMEGDEISFLWNADYFEPVGSTNVSSIEVIGILFDPETGNELVPTIVFLELNPVSASVIAFEEIVRTMGATGLLYLDFHLRHVAGNFEQATVFRIDELVLKRASPVPVPAALWMFVSGLAGVFALAKGREERVHV